LNLTPCAASDGGDDLVGIGDPLEGLRLGVVIVEEAVDGGLEVGDGSEDAACEAALGQDGEEAPRSKAEPLHAQVASHTDAPPVGSTLPVLAMCRRSPSP